MTAAQLLDLGGHSYGAHMELEPRPISRYAPNVSHLHEDSFKAHHQRPFFLSRLLGIDEATGGDFGMRVVHARPGAHAATAWHYHTGALQIVYCVRGWEQLELEDGTSVRLEAGSCLNIPPGMGHRELDYSDDFEVIVITSPADMGTVEIDPPADVPDRALD